MPGKIFVNYRRDDVPGDARGVRDGLVAKFGKSNIFMDVDNLLVGQRFDIQLATALDDCDMLLAVIGPRWHDLLKARVASGERDYVREEIAEALKRRIAVVPVRIGREGSMPALPNAEELPEDIREFALYQKHDVAHERFGRDMSELVAAIVALRKATSGVARPNAAPGKSWGWMSAVAAIVLTIGYSVAYYSGVPVPWPGAPLVDSRLTDAAASAKVDDDARARATEAERAASEAKRKTAEAEHQRLAALKADEERQRAAAEAKRKADEELRAKMAVEAEAKRKSDETDRVTALKADEQRQRAAVEVERKTDDVARAKAVAEAEARRKSDEADRLTALKADEEAQRIAALKQDPDRLGASSDQRPSLSQPQSVSPSITTSEREPGSTTSVEVENRESLVRYIQQELKRIGCYRGSADGIWGESSRGGVINFSNSSGVGLASNEPNLLLLEQLRNFAFRACQQQCSAGHVEREGLCVPFVRPSRLQPKEVVKPKVDPNVAARERATRQRAEQRAATLEKERQASISRAQKQRSETPPPSKKSVPMCFPENSREGGMVRCDDPRALR